MDRVVCRELAEVLAGLLPKPDLELKWDLDLNFRGFLGCNGSSNNCQTLFVIRCLIYGDTFARSFKVQSKSQTILQT